jgi:hypothetical protein
MIKPRAKKPPREGEAVSDGDGGRNLYGVPDAI